MNLSWKKTVFIICVFALSVLCPAQDSVTLYYSNRKFDQFVEREKAKFFETIIRANGTVTTIQRDLKKDLIIYRKAEKGKEPVGVWITGVGMSGLEERDYDFELKYEKKECVNPDVLLEMSNLMADNPAL